MIKIPAQELKNVSVQDRQATIVYNVEVSSKSIPTNELLSAFKSLTSVKEAKAAETGIIASVMSRNEEDLTGITTYLKNSLPEDKRDIVVVVTDKLFAVSIYADSKDTMAGIYSNIKDDLYVKATEVINIGGKYIVIAYVEADTFSDAHSVITSQLTHMTSSEPSAEVTMNNTADIANKVNNIVTHLDKLNKYNYYLKLDDEISAKDREGYLKQWEWSYKQLSGSISNIKRDLATYKNETGVDYIKELFSISTEEFLNKANTALALASELKLSPTFDGRADLSEIIPTRRSLDIPSGKELHRTLTPEEKAELARKKEDATIIPKFDASPSSGKSKGRDYEKALNLANEDNDISFPSSEDSIELEDDDIVFKPTEPLDINEPTEEEEDEEKNASASLWISKTASDSSSGSDPWKVVKIGSEEFIVSSETDDDAEKHMEKKASLASDSITTIIAKGCVQDINEVSDLISDDGVLSKTICDNALIIHVCPYCGSEHVVEDIIPYFKEIESRQEECCSKDCQCQPYHGPKPWSSEDSGDDFAMVMKDSKRFFTSNKVSSLQQYANSLKKSYFIVHKKSNKIILSKTADTAYKKPDGSLVKPEDVGIDKDAPVKPKEVKNEQGETLTLQEVTQQ